MQISHRLCESRPMFLYWYLKMSVVGTTSIWSLQAVRARIASGPIFLQLQSMHVWLCLCIYHFECLVYIIFALVFHGETSWTMVGQTAVNRSPSRGRPAVVGSPRADMYQNGSNLTRKWIQNLMGEECVSLSEQLDLYSYAQHVRSFGQGRIWFDQCI